MPNGNQRVTGWVGWVYFAGILLILRGISEAFLGVTALVNKHYLFIANSRLVYASNNMTAWGCVDIAIGVLLAAVGLAVLRGSLWARVTAIVIVSASFLVNIGFLAFFPVWAIVAMLVDVAIIYALIVHGDEARL
jgi:hypothetical protein